MKYMMEWQPIETAPKDKTWVLVGRIGGKAVVVTRLIPSMRIYQDWRGDIAPTHWMPLPAPPEEKP